MASASKIASARSRTAGTSFARVEDAADLAHRAPVLVVMVVAIVATVRVQHAAVAVRSRLARLRYDDVDVVGVEGAATHSPHVELEGNAETGEIGEERASRQTEIEQRAEQHVARDAREGVEVQDARTRPLARPRRLLFRAG